MSRLMIAIILVLVGVYSAPIQAAPKRLTAKELHAFLFRTLPSMTGSQDFFRELRESPELRAYYDQLIETDPVLKREMQRQQRLWQTYVDLSAKYLPPTHPNHAWIETSHTRTTEALKNWQSLSRLKQLKQIDEWEASRFARAETLRVEGLPADMDLGTLQAYPKAYDRYLNLYRQKLKEEKVEPRPDTAPEFEAFKKFAVGKMREARSQNFEILIQMAAREATTSAKIVTGETKPSPLTREFWLGLARAHTTLDPKEDLKSAEFSLTLGANDPLFQSASIGFYHGGKRAGDPKTDEPIVGLELPPMDRLAADLGRLIERTPVTPHPLQSKLVGSDLLPLMMPFPYDPLIHTAGWRVTLGEGRVVKIPVTALIDYLRNVVVPSLNSEKRSAVNQLIRDVIEREIGMASLQVMLEKGTKGQTPAHLLAKLERMATSNFGYESYSQAAERQARQREEARKSVAWRPTEWVERGGDLTHPRHWDARDLFSPTPYGTPEGYLLQQRRRAVGILGKLPKVGQLGAYVAMAAGIVLGGMQVGIRLVPPRDEVAPHPSGGVVRSETVDGVPPTVPPPPVPDESHKVKDSEKNKHTIYEFTDVTGNVPRLFFELSKQRSLDLERAKPVAIPKTFTLKSVAPHLRDPDYNFAIHTPEGHVVTGFRVKSRKVPDKFKEDAYLVRDPFTGFYAIRINPSAHQGEDWAKFLNNSLYFEVDFAPDPNPVADFSRNSKSLQEVYPDDELKKMADELETEFQEKRLSAALRKQIAAGPLTVQGLVELIAKETNYTKSLNGVEHTNGVAEKSDFKKYVVDGQLYFQCDGAAALTIHLDSLTWKRRSRPSTINAFSVDPKAREIQSSDAHRLVRVDPTNRTGKEFNRVAFADPTPATIVRRPDDPEAIVSDNKNPPTDWLKFLLLKPRRNRASKPTSKDGGNEDMSETEKEIRELVDRLRKVRKNLVENSHFKQSAMGLLNTNNPVRRLFGLISVLEEGLLGNQSYEESMQRLKEIFTLPSVAITSMDDLHNFLSEVASTEDALIADWQKTLRGSKQGQASKVKFAGFADESFVDEIRKAYFALKQAALPKPPEGKKGCRILWAMWR